MFESQTAATGGDDSKRDAMPTMGFLDHLEELRTRLVYSIAAVAVGFFACWWKVEAIYEIMQRPIMKALKDNGMSERLVYLNPTEPFNLYLKIAALAGLFLTSPFVLYQVWMFISPGLYRNEKRYVVPFMVSTIALFTTGGYFGYKVVYPQALRFLVHFGRQFTPMITIEDYTSFFLSIILGLGISFEMPILIFFLAMFGIVSPRFLWKNIRYAILVIFIIRTNGRPWNDLPQPALVASSLVALAVAVVVPFTPAGRWFGFEAPPLGMLGGIGFLVLLYLVCAELLKRVAVAPSAASSRVAHSSKT